jgi:L-fuconolactonase
MLKAMRRMPRRAFLRSSCTAGLGVACLQPAAWAAGEPPPAPLDVPITDSHVHFWDPEQLDYAWLRRSPIGGPKLPADYWKAAAGFKVDKVVFVQAECRRDQGPSEAHWVEQLAQKEPRLAGIVAFAPMDEPKALAAALEDFSRRPLVKGLRHLIQGEKETDFCLRPEFVAGVKRLAGTKLVFEVGARDQQLAAVAKLVAQCPEVAFVLDHLGNPRIREGTFQTWSEDLRKLAALPNLCCKVSGAVTKADWKTWTPEQLQPYIEHVLQTFGFDRVMFGSDWPVCTQACSLGRWMQVLSELTRGCTHDERARLWNGNARRLFRI